MGYWVAVSRVSCEVEVTAALGDLIDLILCLDFELIEKTGFDFELKILFSMRCFGGVFPI